MEIITDKILINSTLPILATILHCEDEMGFRDYMLLKNKRFEIANAKYFIVNSIQDIWPIANDGLFICLHYMFDPLVGLIPVPVFGSVELAV